MVTKTLRKVNELIAKLHNGKHIVACVADGNLPVCELVHKSLSETPNELLRSV